MGRVDDIPSPPRDLADDLGPEPAKLLPTVPRTIDDEFSRSAALSVATIAAGILLSVPMVILSFLAALVVPFGPVIWFLFPICLTVLGGSALRSALRGNAGAAATGAKRRPGLVVLASTALAVTLGVWLIPVAIGQYLAASFP